VPETLRGRLALTYAAVILVLVAALGGWIIFAVRDLYLHRLEAQLAEEARLVAAATGPALSAGAPPSELDALVQRLGSGIDTRLTIVARDGTVLADSKASPQTMPNLAEQPEIAAAWQSGYGSHRGADAIAVAVPIEGGQGAVARVSLALAGISGAIWQIQRNVIVGAVASVAVTAVVALLVARRITGPLAALQRHATEVAAGQLDTEVVPVAPRELADVARAFNAMTARIRELMELSERERSRLEAIFANLGDGVLIVDEREAVRNLNAAAEAMVGVSAHAPEGQPLVVVARDHDLVALVRAALASGTTQEQTIQHARTGRIIEALAQPVTIGEERVAIVVLRDVTTVRRLETVRREFVANVSHELRTPLASIRALVETLEAGAMDDAAVAGDFLQRIITEVDRLTALVDELLDLARLESGRIAMRLERVPVRDLVIHGAERLRPQTERARLNLVVDVPDSLPPVLADRVRIEQVLVNLIHNAIKFTPAEGTITVRAGTENDRVWISVSDTGVGIPEAELPRIFERFYKADRARRTEGTGLGLAIAKHIVQAHRGTIEASSVPGQGSTFRFTLPIAGPGEPARVTGARSGDQARPADHHPAH
jgi:two-component system phosphate regulon sensor histidine kinase PhoR